MIYERKPLVTLVMLSYNQEDFIEEAVKSALCQDYENLEIIISDDCSSDKTFLLIEKLVEAYTGPHKVVINRNEVNSGLAEHYNKVLDLSSGEIIVAAAGDDICYPYKVSKLVSPMLENEKVVATHSAIMEIDIVGKYRGIRKHNFEKKFDILTEVVKNGTSIVAQSHAFRINVFDYFGPFNNDVSNEGKVFAFREAYLGDVLYIDEPLTYYRVGCGVSTYLGGDINEVFLGQAKKVVSWRYSALRQIKDDLESINILDGYLFDLVNEEREYYQRLYSLLQKKSAIKNLLAVARSKKGSRQAIIYYTKSYSPYLLRWLYVRIRGRK